MSELTHEQLVVEQQRKAKDYDTINMRLKIQAKSLEKEVQKNKELTEEVNRLSEELTNTRADKIKFQNLYQSSLMEFNEETTRLKNKIQALQTELVKNK